MISVTTNPHHLLEGIMKNGSVQQRSFISSLSHVTGKSRDLKHLHNVQMVYVTIIVKIIVKIILGIDDSVAPRNAIDSFPHYT